jgi:glycerol-3-phosphate acyltransferase PlsY
LKPDLIVALIVVAFMIGAIPFGLLISRTFYATDLRQAGSGNIGAANALRTLGKRGAVAVLLLDALKGFVPTLGVLYLAGPIAGAAAGIAAVAGHCWSPLLGGRGGKGVATLFGSLFALWWPAGLIFAIVWLAAVLVTAYSSVASMTATAAMIPVLGFALGTPGLAFGVVATAIVFVRHKENLERLRRGTENRFSMLKAKRT